LLAFLRLTFTREELNGIPQYHILMNIHSSLSALLPSRTFERGQQQDYRLSTSNSIPNNGLFQNQVSTKYFCFKLFSNPFWVIPTTNIREWFKVLKKVVMVRVKIFWPGSGWVSHLWFGFEFGKFPLKMSNFSIFFLLGQKVPRSKAGLPLIYCGSKVSSGRVGSGQGLALEKISVLHISDWLNRKHKTEICAFVLLFRIKFIE